jgi:hypothetical protein
MLEISVLVDIYSRIKLYKDGHTVFLILSKYYKILKGPNIPH